MKWLRLLSVFSVVVMALVFNAAHPSAQTNERLGSVIFPISCTADLQKPFERAVSLLHWFVYEEAQGQFEEVFKKDPGCAMALWGEAMSIYYPLWFQPSAETIQHGQQLIEQAQRTRSENGARTKLHRRPGGLLQGIRNSLRVLEPALMLMRCKISPLAIPMIMRRAIFYALALLAATPPKRRRYPIA